MVVLNPFAGDLETARKNAETALANRDAAQGYARDRGYGSGREDNGPTNFNGPGGNSGSGGCAPAPGCGTPGK